MQQKIIDSAYVVAQRVGYMNLTKAEIARAAGMSISWLDKQGFSMPDVIEALKAKGVLPGEPGASTAKFSRTWSKHTEQAILDVAYRLADEQGLLKVTQQAVADAASVGKGTVTLRFGNMHNLRSAVVALAAKRENSRLVTQGEALGISPA